jgi:hypothetical protein
LGASDPDIRIKPCADNWPEICADRAMLKAALITNFQVNEGQYGIEF